VIRVFCPASIRYVLWRAPGERDVPPDASVLTMRLHRTLSLITLVLISAAGVAHAGPPAPPPAPEAPMTTTAAVNERARKLQLEGAKLFDEGKFPQAYVAFLAAWGVSKLPGIAQNLADCEMNLGKFRDAAEHFRYVAKDTSADSKPEDRKRAQTKLDDVLKRIVAITVIVPIDDAVVVLDGVPLGKSPFHDSVYVDPGAHTLDATHEGYEPARISFEAAAGSTPIVRLPFKPAKRPEDEPNAFDKVRPWVLRVGGGVGVIGIVAGAATAAAANAKAKSAVAQRAALGPPGVCADAATTALVADCATLKDTGAKQSALANASVGTFITGGFFLLATGGLYAWTVLAHKNDGLLKPLTGLRVAPVVGVGEGGVTVVGRW
jgi:hypothetical protein